MATSYDDDAYVCGTFPSRQLELQDACAILAHNPRSTNLHFRPGVVPGGHSFRPSYHRPSLITGQTIIPPIGPLAQLSPRLIAPPPPTWPMECTLLSSFQLLWGERQMVVRLYLLPPQPTTSFWLIPVRRVLPTTWRLAGRTSSALQMLQ
jgi:hypothetical protein